MLIEEIDRSQTFSSIHISSKIKMYINSYDYTIYFGRRGIFMRRWKRRNVHPFNSNKVPMSQLHWIETRDGVNGYTTVFVLMKWFLLSNQLYLKSQKISAHFHSPSLRQPKNIQAGGRISAPHSLREIKAEQQRPFCFPKTTYIYPWMKMSMPPNSKTRSSHHLALDMAGAWLWPFRTKLGNCKAPFECTSTFWMYLLREW